MQTRRVRTKICGMTRVEDINAAAEAGADAVGLVFYPPSPRGLTVREAGILLKHVPPFLTTVGLFVNPDSDEVREVIDLLPIDVMQFHGDETADFCMQFRRPYVKAVRVPNDPKRAEQALEQVQIAHPDAQGYLLDFYDKKQYGGTGKTLDWTMLANILDGNTPFILAGGLNVDNIREAIDIVNPYAVDVSSGVEGKIPGIKEPQLVATFVERARMTIS